MARRVTVRLSGRVKAARAVGASDGGRPPAGGAGGDASPAGLPASAELTAHLAAESHALQQARAALEGAAARLRTLREDLLRDAETQLLDLAVGIARKILAQEIQAGRYDIEPIVKAALLGVPPRQDVVIHLHPADWARCGMAQRGGEAGESEHLRFVSDPSIPPAGCVIETPEGIVESAVETQLAQTRQALAATE